MKCVRGPAAGAVLCMSTTSALRVVERALGGKEGEGVGRRLRELVEKWAVGARPQRSDGAAQTDGGDACIEAAGQSETFSHLFSNRLSAPPWLPSTRCVCVGCGDTLRCGHCAGVERDASAAKGIPCAGDSIQAPAVCLLREDAVPLLERVFTENRHIVRRSYRAKLQLVRARLSLRRRHDVRGLLLYEKARERLLLCEKQYHALALSASGRMPAPPASSAVAAGLRPAALPLRELGFKSFIRTLASRDKPSALKYHPISLEFDAPVSPW
ncbi:hypothetical protein DIPPA_18738 [Diplonema papillatum]|nr:hypothetical protein DIPPA_18738 [Diplonema papillatum]